MATKAQIKTYLSTRPVHERILRFLMKMELNKDNPTWANDAEVRRVYTDGALDPVKIRDKFIERGLATKQEFNQAVQDLRGFGIIDATGLSPKGEELLAAYQEIRAQKEQEAYDNKILEHAQRIMQFPKAERDEFIASLPADVQAKVAELEQQ